MIFPDKKIIWEIPNIYNTVTEIFFTGKEVNLYENYCWLRDALGLTDYKVAKDTGIDPATFSNWKSGKSSPKLPKLLLLARYFGVPLDDLVNAEDVPHDEE